MQRLLHSSVTSVAVRREPDAVTVIIQGKGIFNYQIVPVDVLRLVLDFPGAISLLSFRTLPVGNTILNQIRIGKNKKNFVCYLNWLKEQTMPSKKGKRF